MATAPTAAPPAPHQTHKHTRFHHFSPHTSHPAPPCHDPGTHSRPPPTPPHLHHASDTAPHATRSAIHPAPRRNNASHESHPTPHHSTCHCTGCWMSTACPNPPFAPRFPVATLRCEYYLKLGPGGHRTPTSAGPAVPLTGCCEGGLSVATPHTVDAYSQHTAPLLVTVPVLTCT